MGKGMEGWLVGWGGAGTESRTKGRGEGGVLEIRRRPRKKKRLSGAESGAKIPQTKFCIHTYICIFLDRLNREPGSINYECNTPPSTRSQTTIWGFYEIMK